jgi:integrase
MLRIAERKRYIARTPFVEVELLDERGSRRRPHIVTFDEEQRVLAVAVSQIRVLAVLLLETGLRPNREALMLKWDDVDFLGQFIRVESSKTQAGVRNVPLSARCKTELQNWRNMAGSEVSAFVFRICVFLSVH